WWTRTSSSCAARSSLIPPSRATSSASAASDTGSKYENRTKATRIVQSGFTLARYIAVMEAIAMRRQVTGFILAGTLLASGVIAQQRKQQEIDLQAAIRTETVNGDLKAAIKQYSEIVSKYKTDRAVAAMALVRMADAYQKMGDAESRKIYELVVRE